MEICIQLSKLLGPKCHIKWNLEMSYGPFASSNFCHIKAFFFQLFFVKCCKWFFCNTFEKKVPNIFSVQLKVLLVETMNLLMWYKINISFFSVAVYICIIRIPRICSKKKIHLANWTSIFHSFLPWKPFFWTKIRIGK